MAYATQTKFTNNIEVTELKICRYTQAYQ